ncbi:TrmH family RNA methyltransferase [Clostridium sp.]|uniref:TrmH family RNA methyltransferase n=1 Tax=Clostridium sp. TaxID=1506 RepID=UPI0034642026
MRTIESKDNTFIKEVKKLKDRKQRKASKQFLVEGIKSIEEVISSSYTLDSILYSHKVEGKIDSIIEGLTHSNVKIYEIKHEILKSLCSTENPQGVLAVVNMKDFKVDVLNNGFYVLVDKVQDPGNIGTIIRSAHASGAKGIIVTKGTVDIFNDKALRSTMGSAFHIPIIEDDGDILPYLKSKGYKFLVSSLQSDKNFFEVDLKGNLVLCVGNEGSGISDYIYDLGDIRVKIPMPGGAESLNVAVASSIMMFEIVRQNLI